MQQGDALDTLLYKLVYGYVIPFSIAESACGRKCLLNVPALRHSAENRFVSDAYVYGCVDGEIFEMLDEGLVKEERFSIC